MKALATVSSLPNTAAAHPTYTDLMSALVNLGFQPKQAETAAHSTLTEHPTAPFEELFRVALKKVA
jgi:Holliday junction resolvasome RuvABC DNA-binding subunit